MKTLQQFFTFFAVAMLGTAALASSHREAPAISLDPAADNTDLYAWVTPGTHDSLHVVAAFNPLEEPSGGPNFHRFDDNVRYELHIARGAASLDDAVTYYVFFETTPVTVVSASDIATLDGTDQLFKGLQFFRQLAAPPPDQTYTVIKVENGVETVLVEGAPVAPPNIGPRTNVAVYGQAYTDAYAASFIRNLGSGGSEGRIWAGPRDDGFYVDLGGVFDLANILPPGAEPAAPFDQSRANPTDGVSGYNCHAIVFEIPTTKLTGTGVAPAAGTSDAQTLGVWAAASRRKVEVKRTKKNRNHGQWVQVSRLGLPLVNEALIGLQDKDTYNRTQPKDDLTNFAAYFLNPVVVRNADFVGIYDVLGVDPDAAGLKFDRFDIIDVINLKDIPSAGAHNIQTIGDVLRVDMGVDSGFPNGRPIPGGAAANQEQADVTDVLLSVILAGGALTISDNVNYNDKDFLTEMPWLPLPWEGLAQGHGKPAL